MKKLHGAALTLAITAIAVTGGLGVAHSASAQPAAANQNAESATDAGHGVELRPNERVVKAFLREVIDGHNGSATAGLVTSDVAWHGGTLGVVSGRAAVEGLFTAVVTALPDLHSTTYDVVAQGDKVVVRQVITGTQKGAVIGTRRAGAPSPGTPSTCSCCATARSARSGPATTGPRSSTTRERTRRPGSASCTARGGCERADT
ncbi:ester cyclase [Kutzneria buriramensis]|uniref:SnoaL-like polyketide cyclase n=1 Tax=Kutzneria buriramensis TaxID=1045776 RepID=A0A3E0G796_9PSEU|nr:ester cyclase [Kutzneria buriramensis]REH17921.1 SnoaL-like polyketide cyclase [Kutzneria buriramensis]